MKHLRRFNESLRSEYESFLKELDQVLDHLTKEQQNEFMYRITDGETHADILESMLDKIESPAAQFGARVFIWIERLKDRSEDDVNLLQHVKAIIPVYQKYGINPIIQMMEDKGMPTEALAVTLSRGKELLQEDDEWYQFVYQRDKSINSEKIDTIQQMIGELNM